MVFNAIQQKIYNACVVDSTLNYNIGGILRFDNVSAEKLEKSLDHLVEFLDPLRVVVNNGEQLISAYDRALFDFEVDSKVFKEEAELLSTIKKKHRKPISLSSNKYLMTSKIYKTEDKVYLYWAAHHIMIDGYGIHAAFKVLMDIYNHPLDHEDNAANLQDINEIYKAYLGSLEGDQNLATTVFDLDKIQETTSVAKEERNDTSVIALDQNELDQFCANAKQIGLSDFQFFLFCVNAVYTNFFDLEAANYFIPIHGRNKHQLKIPAIFLKSFSLNLSRLTSDISKEDLSVFKREMKTNFINAYRNSSATELSNRERLSYDLEVSFMSTKYLTEKNDHLEQIIHLSAEASVAKNSIYYIEHERCAEFSLKRHPDISEYQANEILRILKHALTGAYKIDGGDLSFSQLTAATFDLPYALAFYKKYNAAVPKISPQYDEKDCIGTCIVKAIADAPDQAIAFDNTGSLTKQSLLAKTKRVFDFIIDTDNEHIQSSSIIGICLSRTVNMLPTVLGILLSGKAFVSIDKRYPKDRVQRVMEMSQSKIIFLDQECYATLKAVIPEDVSVYLIDDLLEGPDEDTIDVEAMITHSKKLSGTLPAYLISTSGTTGKPKGVEISRDNLHNLIATTRWKHPELKAKNFLCSSSLTFDFSILEIFFPLLNKGQIIIVENLLYLETLKPELKSKIDIICGVPSVLSTYLTSYKIPEVSMIVLGGEKVTDKLIGEIRRQSNPNATLGVINIYGPSETTTYTSSKKITTDVHNDSICINIGPPNPNAEILLLNKEGRCAPVGAPGELVVAGNNIATGYFNNVETTQEKFLSFENGVFDKKNRGYKTGDIVKVEENGDLQFLSRVDHQIKILGYRIELNEIENAVRSLNGIEDCKVVVRNIYRDPSNASNATETQQNDTDKGKVLVCYYTTTSEQIDINEPITDLEVYNYLLKTLPKYMIPKKYKAIDHFPLTVSGKFDASVLPIPKNIIVYSGENYVPATATEISAVEAWCDVLDLEAIPHGSDFFELGGSSMNAFEVTTRLEKLGYDISPEYMFKNPVLDVFISNLVLIDDAKRAQLIKPIDSQETDFPLSPPQKRWYLDYCFNMNKSWGNMVYQYELPNHIEPSIMLAIIKGIIENYEIFRSTIHLDGDQLYQRIHPQAPKETIKLVQLKEGEDGQSRVAEIIQNAKSRIYDLTQLPITAFTLVCSKDKNIAIVETHHSIIDGISISLLKDLLADYLQQALSSNKIPSVAPPKFQFKDFAVWSTEMYAKKRASSKDYWMSHLKGAQYSDCFDSAKHWNDAERVGQPSYTQGTVYNFLLDTQTESKIRELATQYSTTSFVVYLSFYYLTLHLKYACTDIIVGSPLNGRENVDTRLIIGFFINLVPMRVKIPAQPLENFEKLIASVKDSYINATTHQFYQNNDVTKDLSFPRVGEKLPFTDTYFSHFDFGRQVFDKTGAAVFAKMNMDIRYDLMCYIMEYENCRVIEARFRESVISRNEMSDFFIKYDELIRKF